MAMMRRNLLYDADLLLDLIKSGQTPAIDRRSKFAFVELHEPPERWRWSFLAA